jgi:hypothetical protein
MARKIFIVLAGIMISMGLGALIALWECSQRRWCPRYLRRQLDAWRKQMERQNSERRRNKPPEVDHPAHPPAGGGEAA